VVEATGSSVAEVIADLDRQFPGMRFRVIDEQDRIRPHIKFFVAGRQVFSLDAAAGEGQEVQIVAALSGG
jgi:hypothetical protein